MTRTGAEQPRRGATELLWSVGVVVVAAFALIALALEADAAGAGAPVAFLASSAACAALPVALRHPLAATALQGVSVAALVRGASSSSEVAPLIPTVAVGLMTVQVGVVAVHHSWRVAAGTWWTLNGVGVLLAAVDERLTRPDSTTTLAVLASSSLVVLLAGVGYRQRIRIREELAAARRDVALEQERRVLAEERTRIARELHDVVAHSMSVIHMQATSAPFRLAHLDAASRDEFASIAVGARGALGEMRQLLGVLRGTGAEPETAPAPGTAQLPGLVEATSRAGGPCTLVVDPDVGHLPAVVGTTIYRIVQEALGNAVRHAHGAPATVRLARERGGVVITIVNGPGGGAAGAGGLAVAALEEPGRGRHGLAGMRERVAQLGGELSHGPDAEGGFRVIAWLPAPLELDA